MAKLAHDWKIKNFWFHIVSDDIFNLDVESIVNSEQTDLILAHSGNSLSGQIRKHFGTSIQEQLDEITLGTPVALGSIFETTGNDKIKTIYHAAFHDPAIFLDNDTDTNQTEYVHIISQCYRSVLERFFRSDLKSIAIPLIGTGLFHLDPKLVTSEFMFQLMNVKSNNPNKIEKHVWLVERDYKKVEIILDTFVQRLIDMAFKDTPTFIPDFRLGVPFIDLYEERFSGVNDQNWLSWLLVRYFELLVDNIFYLLATSTEPLLFPQKVINQGQPISFGKIRNMVNELARDISLAPALNPWAQHFSEKINSNHEIREIMERINIDRNNIAHGRKFRPTEEILKDINLFILKIEWNELVEKYNLPSIETLEPWICCMGHHLPDQGNNETDIGILDKWDNQRYTYLVPHTGEVFPINVR